MPLRLAIVGRPNVGKSTLFNRLAGRKLAIVDDTPGVTRDRREAQGRLGDLDFTLIDTAGVNEPYELGLGEPIAIPAEHGEGMGDLFAAIAAHEPASKDEATSAGGR